MNNRELYDLIICPFCKEPHLEKVEFEADERYIRSGYLRCKPCGRMYPIIAGVPRFLGKNEIGRIFVRHSEFAKRFGNDMDLTGSMDDVAEPEDMIAEPVSQTGHSYSRQYRMERDWFNNDAEARQEAKDAEYYIFPFSFDRFSGKTGLEVACGYGKASYQFLKNGASLVAVDVSDRIEIAAAACADFDEALFVQADIYNLPFRDNTFDFVAALAVLQHLPDYGRAFSLLWGCLNSGGGMHLWVYSKGPLAKSRYWSVVRVIRKMTTRLPWPVIICFAYLTAIVQKLFTNYQKERDFVSMANHWIDNYHVPILEFIDRKEVEDWFEKHNCHKYELPDYRERWRGHAWGIK